MLSICTAHIRVRTRQSHISSGAQPAPHKRPTCTTRSRVRPPEQPTRANAPAPAPAHNLIAFRFVGFSSSMPTGCTFPCAYTTSRPPRQAVQPHSAHARRVRDAYTTQREPLKDSGPNSFGGPHPLPALLATFFDGLTYPEGTPPFLSTGSRCRLHGLCG